MGYAGCRGGGCENSHRAKGLCVKHYNQMRWQRITDKLERLKELERQLQLT